MLSFRVLPRSILDTGTNADLPASGPSRAPHPSAPATAQTVCKLVTLTAPMDPTGTLYPFSFQSLVGSFSPSCSNGTPFISFTFILLRTLSSSTGGYTPLPPSSSTDASPICSISRRPSLFSSIAYKMLLPQLLCFDNDPFSWGVGEGSCSANLPMRYPVPGFSAVSEPQGQKRRTGIFLREAP
jgi:hypothetical protein